MTIGSGSRFSTDSDKQGYFSVPNVSVAPGEEIVWQYTVYLSKEDAQGLDAYEHPAGWRNYAGFRNDANKGKEVSENVGYTPDTKPMTKVGVIPSDDGGDMQWIISLETKLIATNSEYVNAIVNLKLAKAYKQKIKVIINLNYSHHCLIIASTPEKHWIK